MVKQINIKCHFIYRCVHPWRTRPPISSVINLHLFRSPIGYLTWCFIHHGYSTRRLVSSSTLWPTSKLRWWLNTNNSKFCGSFCSLRHLEAHLGLDGLRWAYSHFCLSTSWASRPQLDHLISAPHGLSTSDRLDKGSSHGGFRAAFQEYDSWNFKAMFLLSRERHKANPNSRSGVRDFTSWLLELQGHIAEE